MPPKYIAFFVFLFVVGTVLGLVIEDSTVSAGHQSTLNSLLVWQQVQSEESWGFLRIIGLIPDFFGALWSAMIWDFYFLSTGLAVYVKWFIWAPLAAMFVWGLVITFIGIFQKVLS